MRGAKIYCGCQVRQHGGRQPPHRTDPDGKGAARCMQMALRSGSLDAHNIDYINAHGTSTPQGDVADQGCSVRVQEHADKLAVGSTKGATGHMQRGRRVEMVLTAALQTGILPPTINIENQDPECDLDYVANTVVKRRSTPPLVTLRVWRSQRHHCRDQVSRLRCRSGLIAAGTRRQISDDRTVYRRGAGITWSHELPQPH